MSSAGPEFAINAGPIGQRTTFAAYRSQQMQPPVDRNPET